ncbi:MAG: ketopantoate reductase family protein [Bacteroidota bacterium]
MHQRIAVVGLGAVGGPIAAQLKLQLPDTIMGVTSQPATAKAYRENGLIVDWRGNRRMPVYLDNVFGDIHDLPNDLDIIYLATKADAAVRVCKTLKDKLKPAGLLVSLQNGYIIDDIAEVMGEARTAAAIIVWGASLREDGSFAVTGDGNFVVGGLPETRQHKVDLVAQQLKEVFPVEETDNIRGAIWSKLCVNSCVTAMGAITGLTFGEQTQRKLIRSFFLQLIAETIRVGHKHGIAFEKLGGKLHPVRLSSISNWPPMFMKHIILKKIGAEYGDSESSMLQSIRRNRPPEIEYINGVISKLGRKHEVPTPRHDLMIRMVKEIAAGERETSLENLVELLSLDKRKARALPKSDAESASSDPNP